jgi:hypothetical protein
MKGSTEKNAVLIRLERSGWDGVLALTREKHTQHFGVEGRVSSSCKDDSGMQTDAMAEKGSTRELPVCRTVVQEAFSS